MILSVSFLSSGCTNVLDSTITTQRATYAGERDDFHSYFHDGTVRDIQRILRGETPTAPMWETRTDIVHALLTAQRDSPHALWTLLLVQAFEAHLVKRRCAVSTRDDANLDALVLQTFLTSLETLPQHLYEEQLAQYVHGVSRLALSRALRPKSRGSLALVPTASATTDSTEVA